MGNASTIVLLHGFPSALADAYHVVAPDLPGFGLPSIPQTVSVAAIAAVIAAYIDTMAINTYALYVMDYGAPIGFRVLLEHQDRVAALVTQNGNAYEDGLLGFWDPPRALWADNSAVHRDILRPFLALDGTRSQYVQGVRDVSLIDPAAWIYDQAFLDRPGNAERQLNLFDDYRTDVALYPRFQEYFRARQIPTLLPWGANDPIFPTSGARAFLRDLPNGELHLLDTGHFALEDKLTAIVSVMRDFLKRHLYSTNAVLLRQGRAR